MTESQSQRIENRIKCLRQEIKNLSGNIGEGDPQLAEAKNGLLAEIRSLEARLELEQHPVNGICEKCGNPIHPDRIAVLGNAARLCVACQFYEEGNKR